MYLTFVRIVENSYATISRFILLDSMLLFFTFTTMLCFARFHNLQKRSFSVQWWLWLVLTGLSVGCVCSVKWVGLFVTSLVGIYTVEDLWNKFGDLKMPKVYFCGSLIKTDMAYDSTGHLCAALDYPHHRSHCNPNCGLHG